MLEPDEGNAPLARGGAGAGPTSEPGGRGGSGALPASPPPIVPDEPEVPCAEPFSQARNPLRECPFIEQGLCYQTEVCACASACQPGEQCIIGGFLSPDEPQIVSCVDLR
jgi:hypothetical protein